ncbi:type II secretion system F family protein [Achromobacter insuavis]|uniref:type II secretion system F family protein n=1 Tax=Achromobacter insuavis TaxID=1287735 RepID=UPI001F12C941
MIWLAALATTVCVTALAWGAQCWLAPALRRYRERYTNEAEGRLGELFVFVDPAWLWAGAMALSVLVAAVVFVVTASAVGAVLAAALALRAPRVLMGAWRRRRIRRFDQQLPMALLMLASALRAGIALTPALRQVVAQSDAPLAQEFGLVLREQRLGVPWDEALRHLNMRMAADSTTLVVVAMRVAAQSGGGLAEALDGIAQAVRARLQWQAKVRALTSQGRMQAWIVGGLPVLLLAVLDRLEPDSMALLWHTRQGWMVLALLATLEVAGILLIRRIVRIDF